MLAKFTESRRFYEPNFILSAGIRTLIEKARRTLTNTNLSLTLSIYTTLCPLLKDQQVFLRESEPLYLFIQLWTTHFTSLKENEYKTKANLLDLYFHSCLFGYVFNQIPPFGSLILSSGLHYLVFPEPKFCALLCSNLISASSCLKNLQTVSFELLQMFWDSLFWVALFRLLNVKSRGFSLCFQVYLSLTL